MQQEFEQAYQLRSLEQAYQLGALEKEYATDPKKILANFGLVLVVAIFAPLILSIYQRASNPIPFMIFSLIFFTLVGGGILLGLYLHYKNLHVYVYTNGLLYINGNTRRVVYWQQVKRAYTGRGNLTISVKNAGAISITSYVSRFGELRTRVKQEIANHRNPG